MRFRNVVTAGCAGTLLLWSAAWAQRGPGSQNLAQSGATQTGAQSQPGAAPSPAMPDSATTQQPSPSSGSAANSGKGKEQHWSGSLVDIPCMAKLLRNQQQGDTQGGGAASPGTPEGGAPHFMGSGFAGQGGQQPGGGAVTPGTPAAGQGPAAPSMPSQAPDNSGMTPAQTAQMAKAERVDKAAKQCIASPSTQNFGLAMSGGQVVQFDSGGNSKAQEALKEVQVQPGKKIKAKVAGTMQNNVTVSVSSVEVKGKRAPGGSSGSGTGQ